MFQDFSQEWKERNELIIGGRNPHAPSAPPDIHPDCDAGEQYQLDDDSDIRDKAVHGHVAVALGMVRPGSSTLAVLEKSKS